MLATAAFNILTRAALVAALLSWTAACRADDADSPPRLAWPPAYARECAACHVAYAPGLLPAASWARLMTGLDRHYGADASLEAQDVEQLSRWLQQNADRRPASAPVPEDRITRTARFERKHRHIEPATWRLPSVRSPANCMACHTGADLGRYSEHALRRPEGLSARQRAAWND